MKSKPSTATVPSKPKSSSKVEDHDFGWTLLCTATDSKGWKHYCWEQWDDKGPFYWITPYNMQPFHNHLNGFRNLDRLLKSKGLTKDK